MIKGSASLHDEWVKKNRVAVSPFAAKRFNLDLRIGNQFPALANGSADEGLHMPAGFYASLGLCHVISNDQAQVHIKQELYHTIP